MRSALHRMVARALTRGTFDDIESEILAALEQPAGAAERQRIDQIVERAVRNVPFYTRHSAQVSSLEDLPVMDKLMVTSGVEDLLRAGVDCSRLVSRTMSGATGQSVDGLPGPFPCRVQPGRGGGIARVHRSRPVRPHRAGASVGPHLDQAQCSADPSCATRRMRTVSTPRTSRR